jgi:DNA repair exonuclease SbcCD ATPase subunit
MARSRPRKLIDALKRMIRRRRAPSPSDQEWLRLILLVRRLQHGQLASLQRLDGVRGLASAMGTFRGDFRILHQELVAARDAAAQLESGLGERLQRLDGLPDASTERVELDLRLARLDELSLRLERAASDGHGARLPDGLAETLAQLSDVAARLDAACTAERAHGAQDELARLYERIQELAEAMARAPRGARGGGPGAADIDALGERLETRLAELESALVALSGELSPEALESRLEPLERLGERLGARLAEQLDAPRAGHAEDASGHAELIARMDALATRIEQAPVLLPELPSDAMAGGVPLGIPVAQFEALQATLAAAHEAHRRAETELASLRAQLRASELARIELETRHSSQLAEVADHAGRQLQRLEEDLKKKKRGLSELTQQNIQLQNLVARMQSEAPPPVPPRPHASQDPHAPQPEPPAPLPRTPPRPLTGRIHREPQGDG